jgi:hypothetical protein
VGAVKKIRSVEDLYQCAQLVFRTKPRPFAYLRAAPRSILFPTDAQIEARLKFSEAAKQARGLKGLCPCHGLPWAAHFVKVGVSGFRSEEAEERRPKLLEQRMMSLQQLPWLTRVLVRASARE